MIRRHTFVALLGAALGGTLGFAACQPDAVHLTAVGAGPASVFYVGPTPGPDRPMPEITNPYAGNASALAEGRRLFVWYNCAGCHGDHAGGGMGPSLRDSTWIYGSGDRHIFASIAEGRANGMPAWGTKLPGEQIWKLVAYVRALRTPDEPSPPR